MTIQNAYRGSLTNARGGEVFKTEVGGLVINAGGIELLVDLMIMTLDPGRAIETLRGKKYSARAKILKDLAIAHDLADSLSSSLLDAVDRAGEVMQVRNIIAHGPVAFVFEKGREGPTGVGVLNLKGTRGSTTQSISVEGLRLAVDESQRIASTLDGLLQQIAAGP
jgi:hypothetical protein